MTLLRACVAGLLWLSSSVFAASLVTSGVTFDQQSGLYTYRYSIDATDLPSPDFVEFAILAEHGGDPLLPRPPSYGSNTGWRLQIASGGWYREDINVNGTFYMWSGLTPVTGVAQYDFWFTSTEAPDTSGQNNYFIWASTTMGPENLPLDFGMVIGPNIHYVAPPPVPEPASAVLLVLGLAALGGAWRYRSPSATLAT
ncbi:PEP-CTERM sorting domain-containing protein [Roseateles sp. So40a]|uniref:PEP-CTERM sorting domain-containing protein n=1 Tax=Roseateles sp. So40a TaxID=3400226 RepID=UPI003A8A56FB